MKYLLALLAALALVSCNSTQATIDNRNQAIGQPSAASNFAEAKQISEIEQWKDDPGKIVILYVNFPPGSDNVIVVQCKGVPASSTESLEPNQGAPWGIGESGRWRVPVDGADVGTTEMAGRDGTFGDPVHFRQCLTVDGSYIDIPAYCAVYGIKRPLQL